MWYTTTMHGEPAIMYFTGDKRVCFMESGECLPWSDLYKQWLAEGNTPEPWEATNGPV